MSLLSFDVAKCVHTSNKFATCNSCVEVCPVATIKIQDSQISFTPSECVGCGGCLAGCPTDAYALDDFKPINYIFKFLEEQREVFTCKDEQFPCIASLSVEELLSVVLLSNVAITLDVGPCGECPIATTNLEIIHTRAQEVDFLLEAMLQKKQLRVAKLHLPFQREQDGISRRKLLSKEGVKKVLTIKEQLQNSVEASEAKSQLQEISTKDIANIKAKNIPDRRSLLLMAMKRAKVPETFHTIAIEDISFISQKDLDESSCTNCQMCYRICPTGALSSDARGSVIRFNPLACVQCHSCHDVCEPDALTLRKSFDLANFFEPKIETLVRFDMRRCDECGNFFAYRGGDVMCHRCSIEEEEAKALWGIQ
jgi:ferredoxin